MDFVSAFEMLMADGILELDEDIQILRAELPDLGTNYFPIIDWYYTDDVMVEMFPRHLCLNEADLLETREFQRSYLTVQSRLTLITVEECIAELKQHPHIAR